MPDLDVPGYGRVHTPEDYELLPAMQDMYHGLTIGPCTQEEAAAEAGCVLMDQFETTADDDFDCNYSHWKALFRDEVYRVAKERAAQGSLGGAPPRRDMPQELQLKWLFSHTKEIILESGAKIAKRGSAWIVIENDATFGDRVILEMFPFLYAKEEDTKDRPPVAFPSPEEAYVAYHRAMDERKMVQRRHASAVEKLKSCNTPRRHSTDV